MGTCLNCTHEFLIKFDHPSRYGEYLWYYFYVCIHMWVYLRMQKCEIREYFCQYWEVSKKDTVRKNVTAWSAKTRKTSKFSWNIYDILARMIPLHVYFFDTYLHAMNINISLANSQVMLSCSRDNPMHTIFILFLFFSLSIIIVNPQLENLTNDTLCSFSLWMWWW